MKPDNQVPVKIYKKPRLEVYGDLAKITETINNGKINDGMANKTA